MKVFNSFQLTAAFVAFPFFIAWVQDQTFRGSSVAFYASCAAYVVSFGFMTAAVYHAIDS